MFNRQKARPDPVFAPTLEEQMEAMQEEPFLVWRAWKRHRLQRGRRRPRMNHRSAMRRLNKRPSSHGDQTDAISEVWCFVCCSSRGCLTDFRNAARRS
jgi:hypothetical protein